jgi:hypothetical protein
MKEEFQKHLKKTQGDTNQWKPLSPCDRIEPIVDQSLHPVSRNNQESKISKLCNQMESPTRCTRNEAPMETAEICLEERDNPILLTDRERTFHLYRIQISEVNNV